MKKALGWIVILMMSVCSGGTHAEADKVVAQVRATKPQEVLALQRARGSQEAVKSLVSGGAWASSVLPGVKSGQQAWIDVARALYPGTDAGAREDLDDALSGALLKAPYVALPLLKELWWPQPDSVCVFDSDSELPGGVKPYVTRLRAALDKKAPPSASGLRDACIAGVARTLKSLQTAEPTG